MLSVLAVTAQESSAIPTEPVRFPSRNGAMLVGELHRQAVQPAPWLVLCHGMESTRAGTKQQAMVERFHPAGFNLLRFDFSFVGESEGRFEDLTVSGEVDDLRGALDFVQEFEPADVTLVGSSLGGLVALLTAAQVPHLVRRVITMAAVSDTALFRRDLSDQAAARWQREGRRRWSGEHWLGWQFLADADTLDTAAALAAIEGPILAVHGDADTVVPPAHAARIAEYARGPVRVEMFAGVGHRFEEPGALERLLDIMAEWLAAAEVAGV
jgi:pimeloyl-ACP methyl ester carboxylesterase